MQKNIYSKPVKWMLLTDWGGHNDNNSNTNNTNNQRTLEPDSRRLQLVCQFNERKYHRES